MCSCDNNAPSAFSTVVRRAAKDHRCYECPRTIRKGDLYTLSSGIWDGEPSSYKWCDTCSTVNNLIVSYDRDTKRSSAQPWTYDGFCFTFGSLHECASEYLREASGDEIR